MKQQKVDTVTAGALILDAQSEEWVGSGSKTSIFTLNVRGAKKLSKDPIFNLACWLKYLYGGLYCGETEQDWLRTAKDARRISR